MPFRLCYAVLLTVLQNGHKCTGKHTEKGDKIDIMYQKSFLRGQTEGTESALWKGIELGMI